MAIGWSGGAFCTTIARDPDSSSISDKQQRSPSPAPPKVLHLYSKRALVVDY